MGKNRGNSPRRTSTKGTICILFPSPKLLTFRFPHKNLLIFPLCSPPNSISFPHFFLFSTNSPSFAPHTPHIYLLLCPHWLSICPSFPTISPHFPSITPPRQFSRSPLLVRPFWRPCPGMRQRPWRECWEWWTPMEMAKWPTPSSEPASPSSALLCPHPSSPPSQMLSVLYSLPFTPYPLGSRLRVSWFMLKSSGIWTEGSSLKVHDPRFLLLGLRFFELLYSTWFWVESLRFGIEFSVWSIGF